MPDDTNNRQNTAADPNIRSRHEENAHLRRHLAAALTGMGSWTWDPGLGRLLPDYNLSMLLDLDADDRFGTGDMLDQVHPQDRPVLLATLEAAIHTEAIDDAQVITEFRYTDQTGEPGWLAIRGSVIRDARGNALALSGVYFDVTERKKIEQSVVQAKDALDEANRAKDSFLARVSHDIRTPLTTILGYAELLRRRLERPQDREDLGQIIDSSRYLQSLVDDLLDLSRVIAGKISVDRHPLDLHRLTQELMSTMSMRAKEKRLDFSLKINPNLPSRTLTDPLRVRQILTNLIGNALKFTERGGVSLTAGMVTIEDKEFVSLTVVDTGPGIEADRLDELFQPFSQAPSSDSSRRGGIGLGLAISQRLAEVLGGAIRVKTSPGDGSQFTLLLPYLAVPGVVAATSGADDGDVPVTRSPPRLQGRVLAVDDVEPILSLIGRCLSTTSLQIEVARDGLEALEKIESSVRSGNLFDLILMDLQIPHLDGKKTLQRLRASGQTMPVVALTASAMKGERERCLQLGFTDFLEKPFRTDDLLALVQRLLDCPNADRGHRTSGSLGNLNLLLVEDHEALAKVTARQLESLGFTVEIAHNATAAIDRARAWQPLALVVDLNLPDMDGAELCRVLRQEPGLAHRPFIGYTGSQDAGDHKRARDAGFTGVLVKPAETHEFAALLGVQVDTGRD